MPTRDDDGNVFYDDGDVTLVGPHGEPLFSNDPNADGTAAFAGAIVDLFNFGVINGAAQMGPGNPDDPIDNDANPLPYWSGPHGDGWTSTRIANSAYPSGHAIRVSHPAAVADSEIYYEQVVPIGGSYFRVLGNVVRLATESIAIPGSMIAFSKVALQYLDIDGNAAGNATTGLGGIGGTDLSAAYAHAPSGGSPPSNAAYLRIRMGVVVDSAVTPGLLTADLVDIRNDHAQGRVLFGELDTPASYAAGIGHQRNGLLALGGDGGTRGIMVPEVATPTTPPSGFHAIYSKTDERLYGRNDDGTERQLDLTVAEIITALAGSYQGLDADLTTLASSPILLPTAWPTPPFIEFSGGQTTPNFVYSVQSHWYARILDLVIASFTLTCSTFTYAAAVGNLRVSGLPVTSNTSTARGWALGGAAGWSKAGYTQVVPRVVEGATSIQFLASGSGVALANLMVADVPSGGVGGTVLPNLQGLVIYRT